MKMKKMVGALALSAALAMGTAPAFAAGVADDGSTNEFSDSGSTEIKATIDKVDTNVRATVPLVVNVVMNSEGENAIICPSSDAYYIHNIGEGAILVDDAQTEWSSTYFNSASWKNGDTPADKSIMLFYATDGDSGIDTYLTSSHGLKQARTGNTGAGKTEKDLLATWEKTAITYANNEDVINPDEKLHIALGGQSYFATDISEDEFTDTLCKIKYTIAAAE